MGAIAFTKSGKLEYSIDICKTTPKQLLSLVDKQVFDALCETGCVNYGKKWACPPYSPSFIDFASGYNQLFIIYLRTDMNQYTYIKNDYLMIKAANSILKSRADRFLSGIATQYGRYITTGSCRLCRPCKCKIGQKCANPDRMTYSFEALGINVSGVVESYFQRPLLWYAPHCLPEYTSVVCGLLTNETVTVDHFCTLYSEMCKQTLVDKN